MTILISIPYIYIQYSNIHSIFLKLKNNRDDACLVVRKELTAPEWSGDVHSFFCFFFNFLLNYTHLQEMIFRISNCSNKQLKHNLEILYI